jgi:hypothetical protein
VEGRHRTPGPDEDDALRRVALRDADRPDIA